MPHLLTRTLAASLVLLAGCGQPQATEEVPAVEVERARAALQPFKGRLLAALTGALGDGPASAVHVCRDVAPAIAAELSVDGVEMGRTSHRLRNPANAPAPWVEPLLADAVGAPDLAAPRAVHLEDGRIGYVEPIRILEPCLQCHGPALDPQLLAEIRAVYPEDQATGFEVGDLRGLFWITLPSG